MFNRSRNVALYITNTKDQKLAGLASKAPETWGWRK